MYDNTLAQGNLPKYVYEKKKPFKFNKILVSPNSFQCLLCSYGIKYFFFSLNDPVGQKTKTFACISKLY